MDKKPRNRYSGILLGIVIGIGVALSVALDNIAIGIGVGVVFVAAFSVRSRQKEDLDK
jgi:F0F1-type ATP synthase membrane subunit c/vacuolar-type H+-ATPase subunit K